MSQQKHPPSLSSSELSLLMGSLGDIGVVTSITVHVGTNALNIHAQENGTVDWFFEIETDRVAHTQHGNSQTPEEAFREAMAWYNSPARSAM